ncbi:MAG: cupredoxin domain-containing protein [Thermomicrobiales bacterium]
MAQDQTLAMNEKGVPTIGRRRLLRCGAALGLVRPAIGAVAAQDAATASPAASPAASPVASPVTALTVTMTTQLRFDPQEVMIKRGETITWVNASPIPHTTTGDPSRNPVKETRPELAQLPPGAEGWDSGLLNEGQSFSHTFTVVGEYKYFCIPHVLSGMLGTIAVQE